MFKYDPVVFSAYHAGRPREYAKRFTPYWPVDANPQPTNVFSWTIPGNHDMYSGNRGFYRMLDNDARFSTQNGCSYFLLENDYWQVFGLDTASDPQDPKGKIGVLNDTQINWIGERLDPAKRWILLTHHQPFCAYSNISNALAKRLEWVLKQKQVAAWFWGHDHHCAVYKLHPTIGRPVLLGHGGYPERPKTPRAGAPIDFEWNVTYKTRFFRRSHLKFGYAALHFQNNSITARLIDMDGDKHWNEFTIT